LLELRLAYRYRDLTKLVADLGKHGDTLQDIERWLGHPIPEMTDEEQARLADYLTRMEEAERAGRTTAGIRPMPLKQKKPRRKK
jgi:hypothetical protein